MVFLFWAQFCVEPEQHNTIETLVHSTMLYLHNGLVHWNK